MNRGGCVVVLATIAACGSPRTSPPTSPPIVPSIANEAVAPRNCDDEPCVDVALRFQRGKGVARDFNAATAALRRGCEAGEAITCRRLAFSLGKQLGAANPRAELKDVLRRACALRDPAACLLSEIPGREQFVAAERACKEGDVEVCELMFMFESLGKLDCGSSCEHKRAEKTLALCGRGSLTLCIGLVSELYFPCMEAALTGAACEDAVKADIDAAQRSAIATVRAACDDGDAFACAALPGRAIAAGELCRAGAYAQCLLFTADDVGAGEHGCAAGDRRACDAAGIALRDADQPDPERARALFLRACELTKRRQGECSQASDPDLATGCSGLDLRRRDADDRPKLRYRGKPVVVARDITDAERAAEVAALGAALVDVRLVALDRTGPIADAGVGPAPLRAGDAAALDNDAAWHLGVIDAHGVLLATFYQLPQPDEARRFARCIASVLAK
jgi:TPR repeat protein